MNRRFIFSIGAILGLASTASADAISPAINFFYKGAIPQATVVTAVIILSEALILKWLIKPLTFLGSLKWSAILNITSSVGGSLLLIALGYGKGPFELLETTQLVRPLFVVTLLIEIPLLYVFLRKRFGLTFLKALWVGFVINTASYLVVFLFEIGLVFVGWAYASHLDGKNETKFNNPEILRNANGRIYSVEYPKQAICIFSLSRCNFFHPCRPPLLRHRTKRQSCCGQAIF